MRQQLNKVKQVIRFKWVLNHSSVKKQIRYFFSNKECKEKKAKINAR